MAFITKFPLALAVSKIYNIALKLQFLNSIEKLPLKILLASLLWVSVEVILKLACLRCMGLP